MSDMVYTLKPVKVCLDGDDCNVLALFFYDDDFSCSAN